MQPVLPFPDTSLEHFRQRGFIRVPQAIPDDLVTAIQSYVWDCWRERAGVLRDDPSTWSTQWVGINRRDIDARVGVRISPRLASVVDLLLGSGRWKPLHTLGGLLYTFPQCDDAQWDVPSHPRWHLDNDPRASLDGLRDLMLFTFFSQVKPRGGGTMILAGSPALIARHLRSAQAATGDMASILAAMHPYVADVVNGQRRLGLTGRQLVEIQVDVDGISCQAVELTGNPGDAILCHPAMLHVTGMNAGDHPRIMRRTNFRCR